jgi:hypothetical protein
LKYVEQHVDEVVFLHDELSFVDDDDHHLPPLMILHWQQDRQPFLSSQSVDQTSG